MNSLSVAVRAGYLSVRTAEGASEKQSSLKARLRNGLTYLLIFDLVLLSFVVSIRLSVCALRLSQRDVRILIGLLIGHNTLNRHLTLLK